jgi:hypothetical protein
MKKLVTIQIIIGLVLSLSIIQVSAQTVKDGANAYKDTYWGPNAFSRLAGDDGVLSEEDWKNNRSVIETKYGADFRWEKAMGFDANGDGVLSTSEAKAYRDAEAKRLRSEWKSKGNKLTADDKKWLKDHPIVAENLARNTSYLENHPEVAKAIYSDKKWLNNHPDVAKNIYGNKKFLNNHPKAANKLYDNRKWLNNHPDVAKVAYANKELLNKSPKLRKDLKNHEAYLRQHPKATKKGYKAAKKHPNKAKKTYKASKKHPNKTKRAAKNPKQAKKRARHKKNS